jgi:hypothetical protein
MDDMISGRRTAMTTFAIDQKYIDVLSALGNVNDRLEEAVRRYTIEQIASEITRYRQEVAQFEATYGMTYDVFCDKIAAEKGFARTIEKERPMWEADLNAWEFYAEGLKTWLGRLERISKT